MFGGSSEKGCVSACSRPARSTPKALAQLTEQFNKEARESPRQHQDLDPLLSAELPLAGPAARRRTARLALTLRLSAAAARHRVWVAVTITQTLLPACSTLPPEPVEHSTPDSCAALLAFFTNASTADSQVSVIAGPRCRSGLSPHHRPCSPPSPSPTPRQPSTSPPDFSGDAYLALSAAESVPTTHRRRHYLGECLKPSYR